MNGSIILAGIVAMVVAVTDVTGIQCWTCGSAGIGLSAGCVGKNGTKTTCGVNINSCLTGNATISGVENVQRSCGVGGASDMCFSTEILGHDTYVCYCTSNLCNSAKHAAATSSGDKHGANNSANKHGANMLFGAVVAFAVMKFA